MEATGMKPKDVVVRSEDFQLSHFAQNVLQRKAERFVRRVRRFIDDVNPIEVKISKEEGHVRIEATLHLGKDTLRVVKAATNEIEAVRDSMNALLRQFDKVRLRKVPALLHKTLARGRRRRVAVAPTEPALTKLPNQIIEELFPFLRRVATEKVALYQATYGIEPGYMDPDEIVDEVLVQFIETINPEDGMIEVKRQLFEAVLGAIRKQVAAYEVDSQRTVSTELDIPELDEKIELSTLGDEVLDFWVLDEDLKLEDVIEAPEGKTPEDVVADKEARQVLMNALLRLPPRARYVFSSYVMDDNAIADVAAFIDESVEQTEQLLRDATRSLRRFLTETENVLSEEGVIALYRRMAEMFQVDPRRLSQSGPVAAQQPISDQRNRPALH